MSWKPRSPPPDSYGPGWNGSLFGSSGHVLITRTAEFVTIGGQAVTTELDIPYPHRITQIEVKHTDADGVDVTNVLMTQGIFQRKKWSTPAAASQWYDVFDYSAAGADKTRIATLGYEYPAGKYHFISDTTEGHLLYYKVTIQLLSKKGKEFLR